MKKGVEKAAEEKDAKEQAEKEAAEKKAEEKDAKEAAGNEAAEKKGAKKGAEKEAWAGKRKVAKIEVEAEIVEDDERDEEASPAAPAVADPRGAVIYKEEMPFPRPTEFLLALLALTALRLLLGIFVPAVLFAVLLAGLAVRFVFVRREPAVVFTRGMQLPVSLFDHWRRPVDRFVRFEDVEVIYPARFRREGDAVQPVGLVVKARDGRELAMPPALSSVVLHKLKAALREKVEELYDPGHLAERMDDRAWERVRRALGPPRLAVEGTAWAFTAAIVAAVLASLALAFLEWGALPPEVPWGLWVAAALLAIPAAYSRARTLCDRLFSGWHSAMATVWFIGHKRGKVPPDIQKMYLYRSGGLGRASRLSELVEVVEHERRAGARRAGRALAAVVLAVVVMSSAVPPEEVGRLLGFGAWTPQSSGNLLSPGYLAAGGDINLDELALSAGETVTVSNRTVWLMSSRLRDTYDGHPRTASGVRIPAGAQLILRDCELRAGRGEGYHSLVLPKAASNAPWAQEEYSLARKFLLSGTEPPVLEFQTRYDLVRGQQFGYVEASGDDGTSWHRLPANGTSTYRVRHIKAGLEGEPAFTGSSNGWTAQSVDLSRFQGGSVTVRFHYMGLAIERPGTSMWLVDHIRLRSVDHDGDESSGWGGDGWDDYARTGAGFLPLNVSGRLVIERCTVEIDHRRSSEPDIDIGSRGGSVEMQGTDWQRSSELSVTDGSLRILDSTVGFRLIRAVESNVSLERTRFNPPAGSGAHYSSPLHFTNGTIAIMSNCSVFANVACGIESELVISKCSVHHMAGLKTSSSGWIHLVDSDFNQSRLELGSGGGITTVVNRSVDVAVLLPDLSPAAGARVEILDRAGRLAASGSTDLSGRSRIGLPAGMKIWGSCLRAEVLDRTDAAFLDAGPYTLRASSAGRQGSVRSALRGGENLTLVLGDVPDLCIDALRTNMTYNLTAAMAGEKDLTGYLNVTVVNRGTAAASGFGLNITGYNITDDSQWVVGRDDLSLAPGQSTTLQHSFPFGNFSVLEIIADTCSTVIESDELNNRASMTSDDITIYGAHTYKDIIVENITRRFALAGAQVTFENVLVANSWSIDLSRNASFVLVNSTLRHERFEIPPDLTEAEYYYYYYRYFYYANQIRSYDPSSSVMIRDSVLNDTDINLEGGGALAASSSSLGMLSVSGGSASLAGCALAGTAVVGALQARGCLFEYDAGRSGSSIVYVSGTARFEDCTVTGTGNGLVLRENSAVGLERCRFHNCTGTAIGTQWNYNDDKYVRLEAEGCDFLRCGDGASVLWNGLFDSRLQNCTFRDCDGTAIRVTQETEDARPRQLLASNSFSGNGHGALGVEARVSVDLQSAGSYSAQYDRIEVARVMPDGVRAPVSPISSYYYQDEYMLNVYNVSDFGSTTLGTFEFSGARLGIGFGRTVLTAPPPNVVIRIQEGSNLRAVSSVLEREGRNLVLNATVECLGKAAKGVHVTAGWGGRVLGVEDLSLLAGMGHHHLVVPVNEPVDLGELWVNVTGPAPDLHPADDEKRSGSWSTLTTERVLAGGEVSKSYVVAGGGRLRVEGGSLSTGEAATRIIVLGGGRADLRDVDMRLGHGTALTFIGGEGSFEGCRFRGPERYGDYTGSHVLPFLEASGASLSLRGCNISGRTSIEVHDSGLAVEACAFINSSEMSRYSMIQGDGDIISLRNSSFYRVDMGLELLNSTVDVADTVMKSVDRPALLAGGRASFARCRFDFCYLGILSINNTLELERCVFNYTAPAVWAGGSAVRILNCTLQEGARPGYEDNGSYSVISRDFGALETFGSRFGWYGMPSLGVPAPPAGSVRGEVRSSVFNGSGIVVIDLPCTVENNSFIDCHRSIRSVGAVIDHTGNNFTFPVFEKAGLSAAVYEQDWIARLSVDDGAGRRVEHLEAGPENDPSNFTTVPSSREFEIRDYSVLSNGSIMKHPDTCLTVVPGSPGSSYRYRYNNWPVAPVTRGPLERKNQVQNFSFALPDLFIVPGSIKPAGGRALTTADCTLELLVQNDGPEDSQQCRLEIEYIEDIPGASDGREGRDYQRIPALKAGQQARITLKLTSLDDETRRIDVVLIVDPDNYYDSGKYMLESIYSNNRANGSFTVAGIEREPRPAPPAPEPIPWGLISGIILVVLGAVYLVGRSAARRMRRTEELSGKALPSQHLKEALESRMTGAGKTPAPGAGPPAPDVSGPAAPEKGREAGATAPVKDPCPNCRARSFERQGVRLLVCKDCGYMMLEKRAERAR